MANKLHNRTNTAARPGEPVPAAARTTPAEASDQTKLGTGATPSDDEIRARAYALWEQAGRPEGDGGQFWMEAEKELKTPR